MIYPLHLCIGMCSKTFPVFRRFLLCEPPKAGQDVFVCDSPVTLPWSVNTAGSNGPGCPSVFRPLSGLHIDPGFDHVTSFGQQDISKHAASQGWISIGTWGLSRFLSEPSGHAARSPSLALCQVTGRRTNGLASISNGAPRRWPLRVPHWEQIFQSQLSHSSQCPRGQRQVVPRSPAPTVPEEQT